MKKKERVVVTSIGIVSPAGIGINEFWNNMLKDRSAQVEIKSFDTTKFPNKKGFEIQEFDPAKYLPIKGLRTLNRITQFLLVAAHLALENKKDIKNTGVIIGTAFGSLHSMFEFEKTALKDGFYKVNPMQFPNTILNVPAGHINIRFGLTKISETINTGVCSGLDAIGYAYRYIKYGELDSVLCGGGDELNQEIAVGLSSINKDNIILGEGAGLFVLETLSSAIANNRTILAEIAGYCQGVHNYEEENDNIINEALNEAALEPENINFLSFYSFDQNSIQKSLIGILNKKFGFGIPISNIYNSIGECFAASGVFQMAISIQALNYGIIPFVIDSDNNDRALYNKSLQDINTCLISSIGNCGFNSCLILKRFIQ